MRVPNDATGPISVSRTRLPSSTLWRYAIGSLGTGGFATLPGLVLVYYLTDTLGVTAIVAGLILTIAKVWDVLIDPVIGGKSDFSLAATGSRRRYMVVGGIALPVFFVLTFSVVPGLPATASAVWVVIAFMLCATAFSLFQVPYIALPAELTRRYDERTRLLTWRVVVLTVAILLFGAGGPLLRDLVPQNPYLGYLIMAVAAGVVLCVGMIVSSSVAPRDVPSPETRPTASLVQNYHGGIRALVRSQPFRALLATYMLQGLATGIMLAGAQYVATWVLHSETAVTLLFVALIAPALLLTPVWGGIAKRIGKESGFWFASIIFMIAAGSLVMLMWSPGWWVFVPVAVAGAAYAGMQSLPMAMLPDVISHDAARHGEGRAGVFGGLWTAGETAGMAFGATALTIVLTVTGYQESVGTELVTQSDAAVSGIVLSFSIVPACVMLLSLVPLARYRLRKADIED
ncbi:Na+/melibiose symporter [Paramicrobacterium humi]|uniref:Na+/melibiose symporter n=1 Tax=Paramicrobacterium humi TaxID=640635 RepID=A0A1H4MGK8_9MICO|nr:MFS transporter [Microbacterium humi]SEB81967.1 Na+/melibiose symporter [Microbacterium humi]